MRTCVATTGLKPNEGTSMKEKKKGMKKENSYHHSIALVQWKTTAASPGYKDQLIFSCTKRVYNL